MNEVLPQAAHETYLKLALAQAEIRRGFCAPNPAVGALVVKNHKVLAVGYHWASGFPHAEVDALAKVSAKDAQGSVLYVTLEPCCHYGKTPPCTTLLIERGIHAVYYGLRDPNPLVAGRGEQILRDAQIECHHLPLPEIDLFYQSYCHWTKNHKPWVTAKLAISFDGKTAGANGQPITITGTQLQRFTHIHRKQADAILTTSKTILHDNPQLNIRLDQETLRKPVFVLDSELTLPEKARVRQTAASLTLFHKEQIDPMRISKLASEGIVCVSVPQKNGKLSLTEVIQKLGEQGVHHLWVEAGGSCFQALLEENLVQRSLIYVAPKVIGDSGLPAFHGQQNLLESAKNINWYPIGRDVVCDIDWTTV